MTVWIPQFQFSGLGFMYPTYYLDPAITPNTAMFQAMFTFTQASDTELYLNVSSGGYNYNLNSATLQNVILIITPLSS